MHYGADYPICHGQKNLQHKLRCSNNTSFIESLFHRSIVGKHSEGKHLG